MMRRNFIFAARLIVAVAVMCYCGLGVYIFAAAFFLPVCLIYPVLSIGNCSSCQSGTTKGTYQVDISGVVDLGTCGGGRTCTDLNGTYINTPWTGSNSPCLWGGGVTAIRCFSGTNTSGFAITNDPFIVNNITFFFTFTPSAGGGPFLGWAKTVAGDVLNKADCTIGTTTSLNNNYITTPTCDTSTATATFIGS